MIQGVIVKELKVWPDDRGFLMEVFKQDEFEDIPVKQTTYTVAYPGTIKAFHWHKKQWDVWFFTSGSAQVVLSDLRKDSPTFGKTEVFYPGEHKRLLIAIPPHVAHGYRVLGTIPAALLYHTSEMYDVKNPDEERIPWNDKNIGFDWNTIFK